MSLFSARAYEMPCTIEVEQTHDHFHAHMELDGNIAIQPGDRVRVHGAPVKVRFGEKFLERRIATVKHAGRIRRGWTRFTARFALTELYEVSFTPGPTP